MNPEEELALVEKAKIDDAAFAELYEYYLPRIYGYIYKRVGNQAAGEDLTSQTFLKMVENFKNFKVILRQAQGDMPMTNFKSWLYRIATNTVIDYYRTHKPIEPIEEHEYIEEKRPDPAEQAQDAEKRQMVFAALALLPNNYQQVLHLKFYADLSNTELALSLGITENHLGVLLHRALLSFQKVYNNLSLRA